MKIALDLDDTLINFAEQMIHFHNHVYGTNYKFHEFHSFLFHEVWGGDAKTNKAEVEAYYKSDHFKNITPIAGALDAVEKLSRDNVLFIITSRRNNVSSITKDQVSRFFPDKFQQIYCTGQYDPDDKPITKAEICDSLNIDILIEDSADNANSCVKNGRRIYMFNRPWNINRIILPEVKRVDSWTEVLDDIYKNKNDSKTLKQNN
jgi:uncharacterized HAD superfamily protein